MRISLYLKVIFGSGKHDGQLECSGSRGHADELADEVLSHLEVGDDTATQRTHGLDVLVVGLARHLLGAFAHGYDLACVAVDSHDGGLVDDNLVVIYDYGVGCAEVHGHFAVE